MRVSTLSCAPIRQLARRCQASMKVFSLLLVLASWYGLQGRAQVPNPSVPDNAPNTLSPIGLLPQAATEGTNEQVSLANGALHMFIPLLQVPQRGGWTLPIGYSYDSNLLHNVQQVQVSGTVNTEDGVNGRVPVDFIHYSEVFEATNGEQVLTINLPRLRSSIEYTGAIPYKDALGNPQQNIHSYCITNWMFSDWSGASHAFTNSSSCNTIRLGRKVQVSDATDGSFYQLDTTNPSDIVVFAKSGTQYHFTHYTDPFANIPPQGCACLDSGQVEDYFVSRTMHMVDVNGNSVSVTETPSPNGSVTDTLTDTLGRQIVFRIGQIDAGQPGDSITYNDSNSTSTTDQRTILLSAVAPGPSNATPVVSPNIACSWYGAVQTSPYVTPTVSPSETAPAPAPDATTSIQTLTLPAADESGNSRVFSFTFDAAAHLLKVGYPAGGYTRYEYTDFNESLTMGQTQCSADMFQVLNKYECRAANGQCSQEDKTGYAAAPSTFLTPQTESSSAYNPTITVTDPSGRQTTHKFSVTATHSVSPLETDVIVSDATGKTLRTTHTDYTSSPISTELSYPQKVATTYNDAPGSPSSVMQYTYGENQDIFVDGLTRTVPLNNVTQFDTYDFGGAWIRSTASSWKPASAFSNPHTLDRLSTRAATDKVYGQSVTTTYGYDAAGNTTSIGRVGSDGQTQNTSYGAYTNGYPASMTDGNGNMTTFSYADAWADQACAPATNTGAYLTKMTQPNGAVTSLTYRSCSGLLDTQTDANSAATSYIYDALGRTTLTKYADGGQTQIVYSDAAPTSMTAKKLISASGNPGPLVTQTVLDGLGRKSQVILQSDPAGSTMVDTTYDGEGRVASVSNPYRGSTPSTDLTTYSYDALDRVTKTLLPDGNSSHTDYAGVTADSYDELGNHSQRIADGLGRMIAVLEPDAATGALASETDYTYDGFNNLKQVDQLGSLKSSNTATCALPNGVAATGAACDRQRSFVYDALSRLSSSNNPETGTISYSYDGNGNVHTRTDARGIVTTYGYDGLNRVLGKTYTDGTPAVSFTYDTPISQGWNFLDQASPKWIHVQQSNLVGRLSYASNNNSTVVYGYDPLGRPTLKSVCTPSTCGTDHYDMHASYDLAGNTSFTDRGLDVARNATSPGMGYYYGGLTMSYNPAAQLFSAQSDIVDATHPQFILSTLNYTPFGQVYTAELGSQYGQVSSYDKRNRMTDRSSINLSGYTVLADHWDYDAAGNLMDANDSGQGDFVYHYDTLNRVKDATIPPFTETYNYDPWGNQTAHTVAAGSSYQWAYMPTTQNRASNPGASYDAAGNMLNDGLHTYTYDAESRVSGVTDQSVQYRYDPNGMRVATVAGGAVTAEYLYDMAGELVTTVNGQGQLVRTILRDNRGTHIGDSIGAAGSGGVRTEFRLVNQVGTLVANGDSQGNFVEGCLSGPFGDGQDCTPNYDYTETHFTDKLRDQESTLDYFGARYFNSILGRFTSPDWSSEPEAIPYANLSNPQSLNLYSYVGNNPASKVDKDGHNGCCSSQALSLIEEAATTTGEFAISALAAPIAGVEIFLFSPAQAGNDPAEMRYINTLRKMSAAGDGQSETNAPSGEPPQLAAGKEAHKNEEVRPRERAEVPTPSGSGRMDRYDEEKAHIREIKPDNPRGERSGQRQLERYKTEMENSTGRPHTTELTTYPTQTTPPSQP